MQLIGSFHVTKDQRAKWRALVLQPSWAQQYPQLFDDQDLRLATGPQGRAGYHMVEWIGAIVLHTLTGFHALVSKYQFANHPRKRKVVESLGLSDALCRGRHPFSNIQGPDLLMYSPNSQNFWFCEVKGPGDTLKPDQADYFRFLESSTGQKVQLLKLTWAAVNFGQPSMN